MNDLVKQTALNIFQAAVELAPDVIEMITGQAAKDLLERIERARAALKSLPADTSADDAARRAELERLIAGEG